MALIRTEEVEAPASGQRGAAALIEVEGLSMEGLRGLRLRLDDPGSESGEPSAGEVEECDEENNSSLVEFPGCG
jgi:hypothetical protein